MGLRQRIHGHMRGYTDDGSGSLIRRARLYEICAELAFAGQRRQVFDGLVALSGVQPGDDVLDVGCGTGYLTRRVANAVVPGGHVIGVDPSRPVLDYARRTAPPNCSFQLASGEALPQPDSSVDVVVSSLAIHHLPPANRPIAIREMLRVLRPGGRLLIADFRPPRNPIVNHVIGAHSHAMRHNPIHQLAGLITDAGFHLVGSGDRRPWLHYVQAQRPTAQTRESD